MFVGKLSNAGDGDVDGTQIGSAALQRRCCESSLLRRLLVNSNEDRREGRWKTIAEWETLGGRADVPNVDLAGFVDLRRGHPLRFLALQSVECQSRGRSRLCSRAQAALSAHVFYCNRCGVLFQVRGVLDCGRMGYE